MPKIDHHPSGARIRFYEQPHEYKLDDGRRLISATTDIKRSFPAFDSLTNSARYALKHGLNQQDVLDAWEDKRVTAANFGTEWFRKNRISTRDFEFDTIYVNGGNNLPNLRQDDESWKIRLIEAAFMQRMWDTGGNA